METRLQRAQDLRIGDRVVPTGANDQRAASTPVQGAAGGAVSVGFEGQARGTSYRPGDWVTVLAPTATTPRSTP